MGGGLAKSDPRQKYRIVVIGIGNEYRGDDAIGIIAARKLQALDGIEVYENHGDVVKLIEKWKNADLAIVIDAANSDKPAGFIHRFSKDEIPFSCRAFSGNTSHNLGLCEAIETARALNSLPVKLLIYGIEGKSFEPAKNISPEVMAGLENVLSEINEQLRKEYLLD